MTATLRLGIIGCGRVVERFHLAGIRAARRWSIVAVADPSPQQLSRARSTLPGAAAFASAEALLQAVPVDAVLIAAPPGSHRAAALQALAAGAHVLVEKPCGLSAQEANEMTDAASSAGRQLRVAYNRRFHPAYVALKQRMQRGSGPWALDFRICVSVHGWGSVSGYLGRLDAGGGVIDDIASHQLDTLAWLRDSTVADLDRSSYDFLSPESEEVRFSAGLADGTRAESLARHGLGYVETLDARSAEERVFAFPTGVLHGPSGDALRCRHAAARRGWFDRKLIRVGLLRDPMPESFARQWEAFAAVVSGEATVDSLPDGLAAAAIHTSLAALGRPPRSRASSGRGAASAARPAHGPGKDPLPETSVVIVIGDQRARAAQALESVLRQEGIDRAEVLIVDLGSAEHPPLPGSEHPSVQALREGRLRAFGEVRAEAVQRARGRYVVFLEEHCRTSPGWLRALVDRLSSGPWAAVGPRVVSGNPGVGLSDPMGMINYGEWTGPQPAREAEILPGNNSAYRRQALIDLGPELEYLLLADTVLQWRLVDAGHRLFVEPGAVLAHRYPTTLWSAAKGELLYHIGFAGARAEGFHWPWALRWGYAGGSLLIPWVRLWRMLRAQRDAATARVLRRTALGVLVLLYAAVLGQAVGALFGSRAGALPFTDYELNEPRPTRAELSQSAD